jgi:ribose transport system substrate-binding protein
MKLSTLLVAIPASLLCASVLAAAPDIGLSNGYFGTEWRNQMIDGAKQQFQTYKAKGIVTDLVVQQSGANTGQQIQDMRNMIRQKVGAIMVDANSATALNGVISEAERSKIPVVSFDQAVSNKYAINVTVDHYKWGQRYAEWIAQQLNGKGNVVVLDGIPGHPAAEARKKAALETFAKYPGIKVVWSGYGDGDRGSAEDRRGVHGGRDGAGRIACIRECQPAGRRDDGRSAKRLSSGMEETARCRQSDEGVRAGKSA